MANPYRQHLPELELSLEHFTERTPDPRGWFLFRGGKILGRYPTLEAAKQAWLQVLAESGWHSKKREVDPAEAIRRESAERWSRNRAG